MLTSAWASTTANFSVWGRIKRQTWTSSVLPNHLHFNRLLTTASFNITFSDDHTWFSVYEVWHETGNKDANALRTKLLQIKYICVFVICCCLGSLPVVQLWLAVARRSWKHPLLVTNFSVMPLTCRTSYVTLTRWGGVQSPNDLPLACPYICIHYNYIEMNVPSLSKANCQSLKSIKSNPIHISVLVFALSDVFTTMPTFQFCNVVHTYLGWLGFCFMTY